MNVSATATTRLLLALLAGLFGFNSMGMTAVDAATYSYDTPTIARVDAHQFVAAEAGQTHVGTSLEESVSPAIDARGASTTAFHSVNATNTADYVVLGKSIGLEEQAAKIGGRHLMGSADWQAEVLETIGNPVSKISVALDGLEGSGNVSSRVMSAVQRAVSGRGSPFDWELSQLYPSGRLPTTSLWEGGNAISNPFG